MINLKINLKSIILNRAEKYQEVYLLVIRSNYIQDNKDNILYKLLKKPTILHQLFDVRISPILAVEDGWYIFEDPYEIFDAELRQDLAVYTGLVINKKRTRRSVIKEFEDGLKDLKDMPLIGDIGKNILSEATRETLFQLIIKFVESLAIIRGDTIITQRYSSGKDFPPPYERLCNWGDERSEMIVDIKTVCEGGRDDQI